MSLMNIVESILPHLVGESNGRDCRYVNTYEGESTYEVGFTNTGRTSAAGIRMGLFIQLEDDRLAGAVQKRYPGMIYSHEDIAHYLRYRALDVLPLMKDQNKQGTDYELIADILFGSGLDMNGRRFGI